MADDDARQIHASGQSAAPADAHRPLPIVGLIFSVVVMNRYERMSDFYWSFINIAKTRANTPTLLVNAPSYIAPREDKSTFLLGSEGATFFVFAGRSLWKVFLR